MSAQDTPLATEMAHLNRKLAELTAHVSRIEAGLARAQCQNAALRQQLNAAANAHNMGWAHFYQRKAASSARLDALAAKVDDRVEELLGKIDGLAGTAGRLGSDLEAAEGLLDGRMLDKEDLRDEFMYGMRDTTGHLASVCDRVTRLERGKEADVVEESVVVSYDEEVERTIVSHDEDGEGVVVSDDKEDEAKDAE